MIVAGKNFGCGSSREQAASCLKGYELMVDRQGLRAHLPAERHQPGTEHHHLPGYRGRGGDELEISANQVVNQTREKSFAITPLPKARQAIIDAGGLIAYTRERLMANK